MTGPRGMLELIERKKSGGELSEAQMGWMCRGYLAGEIPDYQVSAWLMAVRWRGMTELETLGLTRVLVASGRTLEWPSDRPVVDKHSTGGVGDKTSIVLVPLLAAAGLTFVKMSGRGLGHTGGTIDKLESIPGFRTALEPGALMKQVARIGCALVGQSPDLVPADGALYSLRDVTATVDSPPLIAASIMSKKLAAGAAAIVLDVKFGSGAFMANETEATELARSMVRIGYGAGRRVSAVLSPMEQPLGKAVGNALEVAEAIDLLKGGGPADLRELTLELGSRLMTLVGAAPDGVVARTRLEDLLASGAGAQKLAELIEAQQGDPRVVTDPWRLPSASVVEVVESEEDGWIEAIQARRVADAALSLGAGRRMKGEAIDPTTGVRLLARVGDRVSAGQPLAEVHAATLEAAANAIRILRESYRWSPTPVAEPAVWTRVLEG